MKRLLFALLFLALPAQAQEGRPVGPNPPCSAFGTAAGTCAQGSATISVVKTQVFIANGTYTPSTGMLYAIAECVGGGGAGGGVTSTGANAFGGGGGGSGGYSRVYLTAAAVGASKAITIGTGGTGSSGAAGGNGSDTSLGVLCVGKGGTGASAGQLNPQAGAGGVAGTGNLVATGGYGTPGIYVGVDSTQSLPTGGNGGSSYFGGSGTGAFSAGIANTGSNGSNYGGGGGGAAVYNNVSSAAGGNGSAGVVIITEFCSQ